MGALGRRLIDTDDGDPAMANVVAVLGGIAAADAATCAALGRRSRGQDHRQAEAVLAEIIPDGAEAGKHLARLLDLKGNAQYGMIHVSRTEITVALRRVHRLIAFAEVQLRRSPPPARTTGLIVSASGGQSHRHRSAPLLPLGEVAKPKENVCHVRTRLPRLLEPDVATEIEASKGCSISIRVLTTRPGGPSSFASFDRIYCRSWKRPGRSRGSDLPAACGS